jgi:nucleoside-triphosphatase THEP1
VKKHLFLTGPACSGKSALLRETLGEMLLQAGGYCTAMDLADDGALLGCSLFPAAAAGGAAGFERERFLDFSAFPPRHDNEVFRTTGVQLLEESAWYPFAVIDEFGGFDLIIPQFRKALEKFLSSDLPVIGIVKEKADSDQLRQLLGLGERYSEFLDRLHEELRRDPDTEILVLTDENRTEAAVVVAAWAEQFLS